MGIMSNNSQKLKNAFWKNTLVVGVQLAEHKN